MTATAPAVHAASLTKHFGRRVAVVDPNPRPGGIAVSTAGIPTKTVREGAIYLSGLGQRASAMMAASVQDPWPLLMARKLEVSEFMTKAVERNLVRHGIERIRGRARFLSPGQVEVEKTGGDRVVLEAELKWPWMKPEMEDDVEARRRARALEVAPGAEVFQSAERSQPKRARRAHNALPRAIRCRQHEDSIRP